MAQITAMELAGVSTILKFEEACYDKFCHYAEIAGDQAIRKLCDQLADRSREHFQAVVSQVGESGSRAH